MVAPPDPVPPSKIGFGVCSFRLYCSTVESSSLIWL